MAHSPLHMTADKTQKIAADLATGTEGIIKTLTYFDIFHYPLTIEEIRQFLDRTVDEAMLVHWLQQLMENKKIFYYQGFYSIQNNPLLVHRRKQGNLRARELLVKAEKIGRFLYQFPFVTAIGISGSLSKNYADKRSDIDFFIITKSNRLWIARTIMHLYKKLTFLTGKQHFYCMNYYIDEKALLLEEQNIFTAIEIKTLLPICGKQTMQTFFETNEWASKRLPACEHRQQPRKEPVSSWFKQFTEWLFESHVWNSLENYLLKLTQRRWKNKEEKGHQNKKGQAMGLITGKHFARSNPGAFQEKVLELYEQKLRSPEQFLYPFTVSSAK
ncbi:MAG: nucleotidyltransferase domain-containing protein [Bacteroidota bacterium]